MAFTSNPLPDPLPPLESTAEVAPPREPAWDFWDVLMIAFIFFAGWFVSGLLIVGVLRMAGVAVPKEISPRLVQVLLAAQALAYLGVLLFMRHLVTVRYRRGFNEAVRWIAPPPNLWPYYLLGGVALAFAVGLLSRILPVPQHLPIDKYFQDRTSAWLLSIFGVSLAPLIEELFFRGFFYPVVARRLGVALGAVLTALGFALMHASQLAGAWGPLFVLFLVGMTLTITRIVTRSVYTGFLIHVGYNATLFTLLYLASDGFRHLEKVLQQ